MSIKIEFPADNQRAAEILGRALLQYAGISGVVAQAVEVVDSLELHDIGQLDSDGGDVVQTPSAAGSVAVDHHNVPHNPELCAAVNSKDPFYKTGAMTGRWKKRRGADDALYAAWYNAALAEVTPVAADTASDSSVVAGAFGAAGAAPDETIKPQDAPSFMQWAIELQQEGKVPPDALANAYAKTGLQPVALFPPTDAAVVADNLSKLYDAVMEQCQ